MREEEREREREREREDKVERKAREPLFLA